VQFHAQHLARHGAPDGNWGFGALDLGRAYTDRTRTASGSFTTAGVVRYLYKMGTLASGDRSTIAWNRVSGFSGGKPANGRRLGESRS